MSGYVLFLFSPRSIGREPVYVDLEADPKIDKDNPPDLKQYADAVEPPPKIEGQEDQPAAAAAKSTSSAKTTAAAGAGVGAVAAAGSSSSSKKSSSKGPKTAKGGAAAPSNAEVHLALTDVQTRTEELLSMVRGGAGLKSCCGVFRDAYKLLLLLLFLLHLMICHSKKCHIVGPAPQTVTEDSCCCCCR